MARLRERARILAEDEVVRELAIEPRASYIVTVANPDPLAWGLVDAPEWLDHPGAEIIFVATPAPY